MSMIGSSRRVVAEPVMVPKTVDKPDKHREPALPAQPVART
jgi:hypothetical protein